ncbi:MAG: glycoside hydrolase family 3 C-terminal domain-containing protein, partial [Clostridia bacterium]|nr:glycoside hydrolase family 3 C-terminal domain-containing protein [Clostridia bacterium]
LYYKDVVENAYKNGGQNGMLEEAVIPENLLLEAKAFTNTAIITINRYSTEDEDRKSDGTDSYFELSQAEKKMIKTVEDNFENIIVLLNTGSMIDTSWFANNPKIKAALMIWQGGMEGSLATANILMGEVCPSGKLCDTCAASFDDYPSSEGFHESEDYVKYTEDIFVGYRYFETIPGKDKCVVYPFGYGLSYTTFAISNPFAFEADGKIIVSVCVKNTGNFSGKEVVQLYFGAPKGKITKASKELCGFKKTKLLAPGEEETVLISFDINDMASFDDLGDVCKSAYVLEKGEYKIYVGNSVRSAKELSYKYELAEDIIVKNCESYCAPVNLNKRLTATGEYITVKEEKPKNYDFPCEYKNEAKIPKEKKDYYLLEDVANGKVSLDDFISQIADEEMPELLHGQKSLGVSNTDGFGNLSKFGIPSPMTIDGPAGVRILPETGIRTTAFPVATMLACTWNTDILEEIGVAGAMECKENNLSIWLTPALNIHRSPLCGRNFEYYSEDPFVSGKMAAAMVRGIQSQNIAATPKHLACNNKETNRKDSDS